MTLDAPKPVAPYSPPPGADTTNSLTGDQMRNLKGLNTATQRLKQRRENLRNYRWKRKVLAGKKMKHCKPGRHLCGIGVTIGPKRNGFHGFHYDMANCVMVNTYTGGKENARKYGYERHPIVLRNAIADAIKFAVANTWEQVARRDCGACQAGNLPKKVGKRFLHGVGITAGYKGHDCRASFFWSKCEELGGWGWWK